MKIKDVEIGASYHLYGQDDPLIADSIEPADRKNGIWDTTVICTDTANGQQRRCLLRDLTPWGEHLSNERMKQMDQEETLRNAQAIVDAVGEGVTIGLFGPRYARLWFTEEAAVRALQLLGAKQLPENRKPSSADEYDDEGWERLCVLLGQRLKRAFGAGYAGSWLSDDVQHPYVAELYFYDDIEKAAQKISGTKGQQHSELSQLIS